MKYAMIQSMAPTVPIPTNGRIRRSARSREAIVTAMVELVGEGTLSPTAQQIAERAEVGVRTVFRHFSDMDTLFAAINERLQESLAHFFVEEQQTGPLAERLNALLVRRVALLERIAPYARASALQRARSPFLQAQHERNVRALRRDQLYWLPELETSADLSVGLELTLSTEAWHRLRVDQKLSVQQAADTLQLIAVAILRPID
jgi:AcrR family transcriptional regulator